MQVKVLTVLTALMGFAAASPLEQRACAANGDSCASTAACCEGLACSTKTSKCIPYARPGASCAEVPCVPPMVCGFGQLCY
ncbi:Spider potassium channel inhibitory toxin [Cordyceps fumosorosea ARSEF 2679]|uniref:Spider potassium channel inhibitory toxin n=1 Tax=Cordyceps fumosorosea (strain ARSEF 2679) TaxID=1081104 RepID=A0A167I8K0_CORFA|nr:Spider potassium channel inhibitory toxin [Cordyceps fumosorosea ARSEF 2679]OAA48787.1 Spider potassium channel inhibitory toxin [Cordyceps fumosorosea ARSEF 2679]